MKKLLSTLIALPVLAWTVWRKKKQKHKVTNLMPVGANLNIQEYKYVFVRGQKEREETIKLMDSRGWELVETGQCGNGDIWLLFHFKDSYLCRHADD